MNLNVSSLNISNFQDICRLCLNVFPSPNARFLIYGTIIENHSLEEILARFFQIEVKLDDILPQYMCASCVFNLGQVKNFYETCQKSRQTLEYIAEKETGRKIFRRDPRAQLRVILPKLGDNTKVAIPRLHPVKKKDDFQCGLCLLTFPTESQLEKHKNAHKTLEQQLKGEISEKSENDNNEDKSKDPEQPVKDEFPKCTKCDKTFLRKSDYNKHKLIHDKPLECPDCHKRFKKPLGYTIHCRTHTGEKLKRDKLGRLVQCEICRTVCSSYHTYRVHKCEKHSGGVKPHICQQCGRDFLTPSRLRLHLYTHTEERPILCGMCPATFKTKFALNHHIKNKHTEETPSENKVKCTKCDRLFDSTRKMLNHRTSHITTEYLCSICGKKLGRRMAWVNHMRRHTGERPYKCQYCDKAFVARFLLTSHVNLHTGEKTFICEVCGLKFLTRKKLKIHKKSHERHVYNLRESALMEEIRNHEGSEVYIEEQEMLEGAEEETYEFVEDNEDTHSKS